MTATTTQTFTRESAICMGPYTVSMDPALYLSAVEFSDIPEMVRILNINQDVFNGSAIFQYPYLESHAQERIQRAHDHITTHGINTHWAMRTSPTGPLIGWAHLHFEHYNEEHPQPVHPVTGEPLLEAEFGYWLSPEHTRKGFAAKAATYLLHEVIHKEMNCDIVRAVSYVENKASRTVAERAGMTLELESVSLFVSKLGVYRTACCYVSHKDEATKRIVKTNYGY
ncbi:MAG: acyl-CoA N-acyltransferase [Benniella sp.]|nr:MAG: acyl-CoA N-acyltransferase [Benniella sp.]